MSKWRYWKFFDRGAWRWVSYASRAKAVATAAEMMAETGGKRVLVYYTGPVWYVNEDGSTGSMALAPESAPEPGQQFRWEHVIGR